MSDYRGRKEPVISEIASRDEDLGPIYKGLESLPKPGMHPLAIMALAAVVLASLVFISDHAYQRYQEYRLTQEMQAVTDGLQQSAEAMAARERARVEQVRRSRAASSQGRWLENNCSDWRRQYESDPQPTARSEMRRHCQIYEQFLATGHAPVRTD